MIKAEYGPTLAQLLAGRSPALRHAAAALALALVAAAIVVALRSRPEETAVVVREPVAFNFVYGPQFQRVRRPGALVALRHVEAGLFLDSYTIRDLRLPRYRGAVGGTMPVVAEHHRRMLPGRYRELELLGEGRTRVNNAIGYQLTFRARTGTRRLYGRHLLLVEEEPEGRRRGVVVELESTPKAGTPNAEGIGNFGALKTPLRSFRFGTEREGDRA